MKKIVNCKTVKQWKAETDKKYGPHLRLYENGQRTTVLLLPKFVVQNNTNVPLSTLEKLKTLVQIDNS